MRIGEDRRQARLQLAGLAASRGPGKRWRSGAGRELERLRYPLRLVHPRILEFVVGLASMFIPANDVGVLGVRYTIGVEREALGVNRRRWANATSDRGGAGVSIEVLRADAP